MNKVKIELEFLGDEINRDTFILMLKSVNDRFTHIIKNYSEKNMSDTDLKILDDIIKKTDSETKIPNWFISIREDDINTKNSKISD